MTENDNLTHLMIAKVCHDLAAPLGSLGMGIESLEQNKVSDILKHSYFLSNFKLRYYRLLMSTSETGPQIYDFVPLLNEYASTQKINLIWTKNFLDAPNISGDIARLVMGFVYLLIEPLVRGGDCTVDVTSTDLRIHSSGPVCPLRDVYKSILRGEDADVNARSVFPYYLMLIVNKLACHLDFEEGAQSLTIKIS